MHYFKLIHTPSLLSNALHSFSILCNRDYHYHNALSALTPTLLLVIQISYIQLENRSFKEYNVQSPGPARFHWRCTPSARRDDRRTRPPSRRCHGPASLGGPRTAGGGDQGRITRRCSSAAPTWPHRLISQHCIIQRHQVIEKWILHIRQFYQQFCFIFTIGWELWKKDWLPGENGGQHVGFILTPHDNSRYSTRWAALVGFIEQSGFRHDSLFKISSRPSSVTEIWELSYFTIGTLIRTGQVAVLLTCY